MARIAQWWRAHRPSTRRLAQLYAALLYNAHLKGFLQGEIYTGDFKALCVPGLNCYSCPGAVAACPLGALQNALAASGHRAGWYVLGMLALFGVVLGRTVCGWLCPMGLVQEWLNKLPTPKVKKSRVTRTLSLLKYAILLLFVVAIPLYYGLLKDLPLPGFCKFICPAGTLEGALALLIHPKNAVLRDALGVVFARKAVILGLIAVACVFVYRAFCRFLCPLGAIYGLFNRFALVGVRVDAGRCNGCGACVKHCEMDVRHVNDRECIQCGQCAGVCAQKAISLKCGKATLIGPDAKPNKRSNALRVALLAALVAALACFNLPGKAPAAEYASDAPTGHEVGEQLPDFSTDLIGGGTFSLSEHRGQVVFINLWATYCGPCVKELPWFDALKAAHPEIEVLAVHSSLATEDVAAWLADKGWALDFALDGADDAVFTAVGGSPLLPQTIVLNRRGEVVYNRAGSVTPEQLEELLEAANQ